MIIENPFNTAIVIPAYKETDTIVQLINAILQSLPQCYILIVDDSPSDEISSLIKSLNYSNVEVIWRKKKEGRGSAVLQGFKTLVSNNQFSCFVEMDADSSHRPEELPALLNHFHSNKLDLLIGSRYLKESKIVNWPIQRRIFSRLANYLARFLLQIPISDYTNGYRIYSKRSIEEIIKNADRDLKGFILLSDILVLLNKRNFKIGEFPTVFINRVRGESSVNLKEIIDSFNGLMRIWKKSKSF